MHLKNTIARILRELNQEQPTQAGSFAITNKAVIRSFVKNPENTFLVSFPRTGSHYLRMLMEVYFERPSLTRVFYFPEKKNYLTLHTHDLDLEVKHPTVIYLYRDPVDTVYSQLKYQQADVHDIPSIKSCANSYGEHLAKWLHNESFTRRKTIIRFEQLRDNLRDEFAKVCQHFNLPYDPARLAQASQEITKSHVKEKTAHDPQVINLSAEYVDLRKAFYQQYASLVWENLLRNRGYLAKDF